MSVICICHTSSHLHTNIFTYYIFLYTSSHTHIFTLTHIFTSSHTHIFSFSLSLTLTSSHLHSHLLSLSGTHIFTSFLSLFSFLSPFSLSFLSPFSLSRLLYLSLFRPRVVPARSHETSTLWHEMRVDAQKPGSNCDFTCAGLVPEQPFRTK